MFYRYPINKDEMIFGLEMPDIINGSFSKELIRQFGTLIYNMMICCLNRDKSMEISAAKKYVLIKDSLHLAGSILCDIISKNTLSENVKKLITKNLKKKEQEKLLKGLTLADEQLVELFYFAEKKDYVFSHIKYIAEPTNIEKSKLPNLAYKDDDRIVTIGGHISDGQAKQLIDQNKVLIAQIISKGDHWHCFLRTFRGLKGMESGKQGGRTHLHYLSDKFTNLSFDDLVSQLKAGKYPNATMHIPLIYRSVL